ncbi:unnamed protein product, partial [Brassica oleracea]
EHSIAFVQESRWILIFVVLRFCPIIYCTTIIMLVYHLYILYSFNEHFIVCQVK